MGARREAVLGQEPHWPLATGHWDRVLLERREGYRAAGWVVQWPSPWLHEENSPEAESAEWLVVLASLELQPCLRTAALAHTRARPRDHAV